MNRNVALFTDLTSYGKCSISVMAPALEMMGVEACPVATGVLSTQTGSFRDPYRSDLTGPFCEILGTWKRMGFRFDGIVSGYFFSVEEIEAVREFAESQPDALFLCDPVFADDGKIYDGYRTEVWQAVRDRLCPISDVITPNATEADFLCRSGGKLEGKHAVITSVQRGDAWGVEADGDFLPFSRYPQSYPGTGDLFDAVLIGLLVKGCPLTEAVQKSETLVALAVERSRRDPRLGVDVRTIRKELAIL